MNIPTILIIEDNPISRKVLRKSLETEHYGVVEAINGTSALKEAAKQPFDLIIQDLVLPDMNGFVLNEELRKLPGYETVPIFALSGFLNQSDENGMHSGFTLFLLKPIEPSYLLDVVKAHLPISIPGEMQTGKGLHILIADDNPVQLKLFSMQLTNAGFKVTTASDGVIALKKARDTPPDAIISDILMPNMDGFSLCSEIKRDPNLKNIPVILLTSHYLEDEDLALAKKVGASNYLTRTPDVEKLILELHKILNIQTSASSIEPFELTEDIKEKHTMRTIRQLEQQVLDNTKLAQKTAILMSQLSLIEGIANALTTRSKDIDEALKDILYFCLDATGISKGALYLKRANGPMVLRQQIGYNEDLMNVESLFRASTLISTLLKKDTPFAIPSKHFPDEVAINFLHLANVKSAFIAPLFSGAECLGLLFLGSNLIGSLGNQTIEFIKTLGIQVSQSIALASVFNHLTTSEKRYQQLIEIAPDAIFIHQEKKIVYANHSALQLLGANSLEDLQTHLFFDFFPPTTYKIINNYITDESKAQTTTSFLDAQIFNLEGNVLDVEIVVCPFFYQEKNANYMIMRDITERKRSTLHLEIQYAIAWILAESATLLIATGKMLEIICERLNWDFGIIWAVDNESNVLRCTRVWQVPNIQSKDFQHESLHLSLAPGAGLTGQVWDKRKAIWKTDLLNDDSFIRKKSAAKIGLKTAVAFPIIYENKVLGVMEFFSRNSIKSDKNLLLWFESIGNQFGLFLIRKHMEKQMLYLVEHDALTGLSNRSLLEQYLNTALAEAKEKNQKLAILFLDLDHFKYINDSLGHQTGDRLLIEISDRFRECLRPQDSICRLGGDEFIILLPNIKEKEEIIQVINRLQNQVANQITLQEKKFFITASIGISVYPDDGNTVPTLIKGADIAMYAAKENGRNNFQFCTLEMTATAENRGILEKDLHLALENNEFILYYQPKIDVATQTVVGMEALIRWKRPEGILLPGSFIAAAENSDLILSIGEWVLKTACLQNKTWQMEGLPNLTISINLSIRNLNENTLLAMKKILTETKLNPEFFEIELTESALMINVENNVQILRSLKEMGLKISIDDFGTGYSSLSYLKRFPIDTLKIDQSFVRDIATDPDDAAIVIAIIAMARSLGFKIIAEGVETEAQLKFLCEHGCDEIQGYYFSRPLPAGKVADFIKNSKISWHFD